MPESAAGKTTRRVTCSFAAPRPNAPSRRDWGTADIASSEIEATVGTTRKPMMMPAARPLKMPIPSPNRPRRISGVKNVSAK
jgi:hypothetical protein